MTKIAVLGARGRLGRAVAKAFLDAGHEVRAITRDGKLPAELTGAEAVAADALDRQSLVRATEGVDIIFNGLSPIYSDWSTVLPMAENVMAACHANGARHLTAGQRLQLRLADAGGHHRGDAAATRRPRRAASAPYMEELYRREADAGRVRTILLRAGDFFGGKGTGSWFDLVIVSKLAQGRLHRAGAGRPGPCLGLSA